jgi:protein TonB
MTQSIPGFADPSPSATQLPLHALALSLLVHAVLLFGPALRHPAQPDELPPLAVSFRLPATLAPPVPAVTESMPPVTQALPRATPPPVAAIRPRPTTTPVLAVRPTAHETDTPISRPASTDAAPAIAEVTTSAPAAPPPTRHSEAPAAQAATDSEAMARYIRLLGELLAQQQQYPRIAAARGWEGEVRLRLQVARKGTIIAIYVTRSSGFDVLDQHAMQLVQNTTLPPPPATPQTNGGNADFLVEIPIHYALKRG